MITASNLHKRYKSRAGNGSRVEVNALNDVSFTLLEGQSCALIGESGSGKSTLAKILTCIEKPDSGSYLFDGIDMTALSAKELRKLRARFQLVMQNSRSALDPRRTVYESIAEPIRCLTSHDRRSERQLVLETSGKVQLSETLLNRLPHELSGGQQQRACIARALTVSPKFVVFDESVSGLDVTVRKQILDLIVSLQRDERSSFLMITHDIDVALYIARNIMVMKDGRVVEHIGHAASYDDFEHEYSRLLIEALPPKMPQARETIPILH
jgi:ABC-type glutathione transport system ATPase component